MTKQKVYNMIFKKILDTGHIKSPELIEFVRETVDTKECRDIELSSILELISQNPNISSGTQMMDDTSLFMEFWWVGPNIVIFEEAKTTNSLDLTDAAISIIKSEKRIKVQDLIVKLGREYRNASASDIMSALHALQHNAYNIKINGSIYPYEPGTEFFYNQLPTLEEFTKDIPHTEVFNTATKSEPKYICPDCGGDVRKRLDIRLDIILTSYPPKYRYECDNPDCKYVAFHEV